MFESGPQLGRVLRMSGVDGAFDFEDDVRWWVGDVPYGSAESVSLVDQPGVNACHDDGDANGGTKGDGSLLVKGDLDLVSRSNVDAHRNQEV